MCLTELDISSTTHFKKLKDLTADPSPMPAPYLSTEFVHTDPSISNTECMNSLEMINHPLSPSDNSPGKSRQVVLQLPSSICNLKALSTLEIHRIKLNQLPENIGELKGLKFMAITGCKFLRTLPDSIGDLKSVTDLFLIDDGITELPESIGKLRNLITLNVSNNRLRRLPTTIGDLERLRVLDVSDNNDLQGEIPGEFGKLRSLTSLNLSRSGICGLPSTMVQLASHDSLRRASNETD